MNIILKLFNKPAKIVFGVLTALIQVANLFLGNIIVYEVSESTKFDWMKLLKSKLFWFVFIAMAIYYLISYFVNQTAHKADGGLEEEIDRSSIKLLNIATDNAERGDFESSERTIKILNKIRRKRGRW